MQTTAYTKMTALHHCAHQLYICTYKTVHAHMNTHLISKTRQQPHTSTAPSVLLLMNDYWSKYQLCDIIIIAINSRECLRFAAAFAFLSLLRRYNYRYTQWMWGGRAIAICHVLEVARSNIDGWLMNTSLNIFRQYRYLVLVTNKKLAKCPKKELKLLIPVRVI